MGGIISKLRQPEPLQPWRIFPESYQDNLEYLKSYKPKKSNIKHLRILLHGPIGAGKSAFINSVDNVFQKRITTRALTDTTSGSSFTRKIRAFRIRKDSESFYSFVFHDIMGLEQGPNGGIHVDDLKVVLKGHVKEGFKFSPEHRITEGDPGYNPTPTLEDRVHVLVSVIPADTIPIMTDPIFQKIRDVRLAASETGIPQLIVITKVDEACPKTKQDVKYAHTSKELEKQVNTVSKTLGIQPNLIFLVQNYQSQIQTSPDMDALILSTLRRLVEVGEDFLNDQQDDEENL